jgi:hypothetical protein
MIEPQAHHALELFAVTAKKARESLLISPLGLAQQIVRYAGIVGHGVPHR